MKPARYHPEALSELDDAVGDYADIEDELAGRFRRAQMEARERIRSNPKMYAVDEDTDCRQAPLKKFPYSLVYVEFEDYIWVVAVAHHRRKPGYWLDRLQDR